MMDTQFMMGNLGLEPIIRTSTYDISKKNVVWPSTGHFAEEIISDPLSVLQDVYGQEELDYLGARVISLDPNVTYNNSVEPIALPEVVKHLKVLGVNYRYSLNTFFYPHERDTNFIPQHHVVVKVVPTIGKHNTQQGSITVSGFDASRIATTFANLERLLVRDVSVLDS